MELPPDVSLQKPLEETSLTKKAVMNVAPSSLEADSEKSAEAQMPMEESWLIPSVVGGTTSTVVTTFATPQGVVTSVVSEPTVPRLKLS